MPGWLDHLLVAFVLIAVPIDGTFERRRLQREIAAGKPDAKLEAYARIIWWQWGAAIALLAFWILSGRSLAALGILAPHGARFLAAMLLVVAITAVLENQVRVARASADFAAKVREAAASVSFVTPSTQAELRRFTLVGITAGIVEELICRGYLIWYFASLVPMWAAIALSSLVFAIGHAYQGISGVMKTGAVGVFLGWLYQFSGSIWAPMLVHAINDVLQGRLIHVALRES